LSPVQNENESCTVSYKPEDSDGVSTSESDRVSTSDWVSTSDKASTSDSPDTKKINQQ